MALARFAKLLATLTLAVSAAGIVTASTAGASTQSASYSAQPVSHKTLSCHYGSHYRTGYATFVYCDGSYHQYVCRNGKTDPIGGPVIAQKAATLSCGCIKPMTHQAR